VNEEDTENQNRTIKSYSIEAVIKSLPTKKIPGLDEFTVIFYQTFQEELTPILLKLFHKIEREKHF
jgi:hypothetical protein